MFNNAVCAWLALVSCPPELTIRRLRWSRWLIPGLVLILTPLAVGAEEVPEAPEPPGAPEPDDDPSPAVERAPVKSGVTAFTWLLETRKRQLVTSYYLYRGPAPDRAEMDSAIGAIDRLILQDYSLEDIWSTIFHIMISAPDLAHRPFEGVTAILISVSQPLPQPFGEDDDGRTARRSRAKPPRFQASFGPTSVGVGFTF